MHPKLVNALTMLEIKTNMKRTNATQHTHTQSRRTRRGTTLPLENFRRSVLVTKGYVY